MISQPWNVALFVMLASISIDAFAPTSRTLLLTRGSLLMSETDETEKPLSFEDATEQLKQEEENIKAASRGMMMEQDAKAFEEKRDAYDEMREKIRSRASTLDMNKSVATQEAIKAATQRAAAGEAAETPTVDLSKFSSGLGEDPEDELTDEQMREIDKVGQMSIPDQVVEEFKNTRFPSPDATLKQAILMLVIFIVTAGVILNVDTFLRFQYTDWGFIPKSGEVLDYSDLALPEGFTDQMTDIDLAGMEDL